MGGPVSSLIKASVAPLKIAGSALGLGGGSNAAGQAQADEAARQARVNDAVRRINAAFDDPSRAAAVEQLRGDVEGLNLRELERQRTDAERLAKFELARSGQTGGSLAADVAGDFEERLRRGLLRAAELGDLAAQDVRSRDESARAGLISQANAGLGATTASERALQAVQAGLENARTGASLRTLDDVFRDLAILSRARAETTGRERARSLGADPFASLSPAPSRGAGGQVVSIG